MISLFLLLSVCLAGSLLAARLNEGSTRLTEALALGSAIGLALFAGTGFVLGWIFGLSAGIVVAAAAVVVAAGFLVGVRPTVLRSKVRSRPSWPVVILAVLTAALVLRLADRTLFETASGGLAIGDRHNFGDLPFHMSIAAGFAYGDNFPPNHPELAGVPLTYPFFGDVISGMVLAVGGSWRDAFFWPTLILGFSVLIALIRFGEVLTGSRALARVAAALTFFSGGLGFTLLSSANAITIWWLGGPDVTINDAGLRYANVVTTMFIPQRSILFGWPLLFFALGLLMESRSAAMAPVVRARRWMSAGLIGSLLPLVHAHSFAVLSFCVVVLALGRDWKLIFRFAAGVLPLALPAIIFMMTRNSLSTGRFFAWEPGFDGGRDHILKFWWMNAGLFLPLALLGLLSVRKTPSRLMLAAPFAALFILANLFRLSPWIWDNMKFLAPAHAGLAPFAALALGVAWAHGRLGKIGAGIAFTVTIFSGFLDVSKVAFAGGEFEIFDRQALAFAERVRETTAPSAIVLTAPTHNHPVLLAGRRLFLGYEGHLWSQGLTYLDRKATAEAMLRGERPFTDEIEGVRIDALALTPAEPPQLADSAAAQGLPSLVDSPYRLLKVR